MTTSASQRERLERRRRARLRQVRRRRILVLGALAVLSLAAAGLALARLDDGTAAVAADTVSRQPADPPQPRDLQSSRQDDLRGRLGSGKPVTLAFGGDIHFESPILEKLGASPASVLGPIAPVLRRADLAVVNLETAVTGRGDAAAKTYTFRAPPSAFQALAAGGVDVANVANNHGMDFGLTGLRDTFAAARRARFPLIGAGWNAEQAYAPYRRTIRGQRIAVIGATQVLDDHLIADWSAGEGKAGLASAKDEPQLLAAVREARESSDTVVVFLHWGRELVTCPTGVQRSLARKLVTAGADVVVGSHAHVLLGAGRLGKALVAYGLGNFVFYAFREETSRSGVLEVTVTGRRVDDYRWVPARISGGIPYPVTAGRASAVAQWEALRGCTGLRR
jgi:poly-gamma-glutamate synthesis protein (capsule biosynthesis protein)